MASVLGVKRRVSVVDLISDEAEEDIIDVVDVEQLSPPRKVAKLSLNGSVRQPLQPVHQQQQQGQARSARRHQPAWSQQQQPTQQQQQLRQQLQQQGQQLEQQLQQQQEVEEQEEDLQGQLVLRTAPAGPKHVHVIDLTVGIEPLRDDLKGDARQPPKTLRQEGPLGHISEVLSEDDDDEDVQEVLQPLQPLNLPQTLPQNHGRQGGAQLRGKRRRRADLLRQNTPFKLMLIRDGEIPTGYNFGCLGADLNLLLPGPMEFVMVCAMTIDLAWLLSVCPGLRQAKQMLVVHDHRKTLKLQETAKALEEVIPGGVQLHAPPGDGDAKHHAKAFLVHLARGLRVIILTANMTENECPDTHTTQGIWWQDFPPKDAQSPSTSPFESDLTDYIGHLALPELAHVQVLSLVTAHDMSSARAALVPSVPGSHTGANMRKYGHMRVRDLLSREPLPTFGGDWVSGSHLALQCSSIGVMEEQWLRQQMFTSMSAAASTLAAGASLSGRQSAAGAGSTRPQLGPGHQGPGVADDNGLVDNLQVHLVWPTEQEVKDSLKGWHAGGGLHAQGGATCLDKPFLQPYLARYGGQPAGRQRAMPHIKSYCRFLGQRLAWVVLGSHNLSKAAWGNLCYRGGMQQLHMINYELSLLFTPSLEAAYLAHRHSGFNCTAPRSMSGPGSSAGLAATGSGGYGASGTAQRAARAVEFWSMEHLLQQAQSAAAAASPAAEGGAPGATRVMMPLPYKLPPQHYNPTEDKPWVQMQRHHGQDILGRTMRRQI